MNHESQIETHSAVVVSEYLMRIQQEIMSTRFKYESGRDNPSKWWNSADLDWVPSDLHDASKAVGS